MGREIECRARFQDRDLAGKAYLETDHVLFRGAERFQVAFKDLQLVAASNGVLRLDFPGGPAELELGAQAEKWAQRILSPPSLMQKLGVKAGATVRLVGEFDAGFLADLQKARAELREERPELIFLAAKGKTALARMRNLSRQMQADGALWVVFPKGVDVIREIDVISAGRAAELKDVKVASFSLTHTGLKFVIPVALRPFVARGVRIPAAFKIEKK